MLTMCTLYLIVLYLSIEIVVYSNTFDVRRKSPYTEKRDKDWLDWTKNRHQIHGITHDGYKCIDNCVDGVCRSVYDIKKKRPCNVVDKAITPVYFTARHVWRDKFVCLGRCGKWGHKYNWCPVTKEGHWDYCNPEMSKSKQRVHLTTDTNVRCKTQCKATANGAFGEHLCKDPWDVSRKCNPNKTMEYTPQTTIHGTVCVGNCHIYAKNFNFPWSYSSAYRCYDINKNYEICAPPAQIFNNHTKHIFHHHHRMTTILNSTNVLGHR